MSTDEEEKYPAESWVLLSYLHFYEEHREKSLLPC